MPPCTLPILIQAEEAISPFLPPPRDTQTAIFTVPHAYAMSLAIGRVVQLKISPTHAILDDYEGGGPDGPAGDGLLALPIVGPVIGVRRQEGWEMEFVVRNDFPDTQITQVHLRVPRAVEQPAREAFARELEQRLQWLLEGEADNAGPNKESAGVGADARNEGGQGADALSSSGNLGPRRRREAPALIPTRSATRWPADANKLTVPGPLKHRPRVSSPLATKEITAGE
ncbi:hypothetical protein VTO73DRAFT_15540 [Trametes versicolor]